MNSDKIILDLCGGTGSWSEPYKDAGYDVRVITLPYYSVSDVVFGGDYMVFNKQTYKDAVYDMGVDYKAVYGILAAPPCTEFSVAKGNRPRDFETALKVVAACQNIIWQCRLHRNLKFWAMENPRGFLRQFIGKPAFTFEQWQFSGNKRKATDLWGYYNVPKSTVKDFPIDMAKNDGRSRAHAADWTRPECEDKYSQYVSQFKGDAKRAAIRAITPPGFAQAFYQANR